MFEPNPNCPLGETNSTVGEDPVVLGGFDGKTEGREGLLAAQKWKVEHTSHEFDRCTLENSGVMWC